MQGQANKIGNGDSTQSGLTAFLKLYSISAESEHESKDIEKSMKSKSEDEGPFCPVCGSVSRFGMFCSINCQKDLYGI
jgi:hypothetical protein